MAAACQYYAGKGYTAQERYPNGNMALSKSSGAERVELWHTLDGKVRAAEGPSKSQVIHEAPPPSPKPRAGSPPISRGAAIALLPFAALYTLILIVVWLAMVAGVLYAIVWVLHALWRAT